MKNNIQTEAVNLRKTGKTYLEICSILGQKIPKSTLSYWSRGLKLSDKSIEKIKETTKINLNRARSKAVLTNKLKRQKYLKDIYEKNLHLLSLLDHNSDIAKIVLAILYLTEGAKHQKGSVMFGNSDPKIISLFLKLMRRCYNIDESKFRCTLQCRADQNINELEKFWSKTTDIPVNKFYKARVDPRSINKISRKKDYMGVCRIDHFSAHIFNELMIIGELISAGR